MQLFRKTFQFILPVLAVLSMTMSTAFAQMAGGTYTIGATGNYLTFAAAKIALDSGITGPVVFNVEPGIYTEQLAFSYIPGSSATNTVTFQSLTGDSTSVVLQFAGTSSANYVVLLSNCSYMTWKGMTIRSTGGANGRVFDYAFQSNHNTITNCIIQTDTSLTSNTVSAIYSNGSLCYNMTISHSRITGGYHGIYWNGTQAARMNKLNLNNNIFDKYYYSAIYIPYTDSPYVVSNQVYNRSVTPSIYYPVYVFNTDGYGLISKNYIYANGSGSSYGIRIQKALTVNTNHLLVTNNMIMQATNTSTNYGISLNIANYVRVLNNSVLITAGSSTGASAFHQATTLSITTSNIIVRNNNFANTGGGYALYVNAPQGIIDCNHNNYFTTGPNLAFWSGARPTLAALQTANLMDANSVNANPGYVSNIDLHSTSVALFLTGSSNPAVTDDYDGDPRHPTTPCIGADEFTIAAEDAGVTALINPLNACPGVADSVIVTVKNWGIVSLNTFSLHWSVNGIHRDSVSYTGSIPPGGTVQIALDTLTIFAGSIYQLTFFTKHPNGVADNDPYNDTLTVVKMAALSGTYTIGTGTGYDFNSVSSAVTAMASHGICGPVVFNIASGTYNEQVEIPNITGTSVASTVTFKSAGNDSSLVTLSYSATNVVDNYVIKLNGAKHIRFKHIRITASQTSTHSRVIELTNEASYNIIENCHLISNAVNSSTSNNVYINIKSDYNQIVSNNIEGGYSSILLHGTSTNPGRSKGNIITGNQIAGYYYYGINATYQDTVIIHGNYVTTGLNNVAYGIYSNNSEASRITANDVRLFNTGYGYCIAVNNFNGTVADPALIANNFAVKINGSTLYSHGIYAYNCNHLRIVFNSVHIDDLYATTRGIYHSGGFGGRILNNNIKISGGGYALYAASPNSIDSCDHNNLFTNGTYLAYWGVDLASLNDLKSTSSKNANTINIDPFFLSGTDLHTQNPFLNGTGMPLSYITTDIDGETRNAATPDIGADEFEPPMHDAWLTGLSSPASPVNPGISPVHVTLKNGGSNILSSVMIHWELNGVSQPPVAWSGNLAPSASQTGIQLGNVNFISGIYHIKAWSSNPNMVTDPFPYNDTITVSVFVYLPPMKGTYTIGSTGADFTSFTHAVNALSVYGVDSAVVFQVASGTYNEQISIDTIPGISASNTVTFTSAANDSTAVTLTFNSPSSANYVLRFDGISYVTFEKIRIAATNPASGFAVVFRNQSHFNTLSGNIIQSPAGNSQQSMPVYFSNQSNDNFNTITGNNILNGYYGIYHYGTGVAFQQIGTMITNNRITGFYHSGIYSYYADSISIIGNYIQSTNSTTLKGIYIFQTYNSLNISNNKITLNSPSQNHGIYLYTYLGNPGEGLISNNYISVKSYGNTDFGIYVGNAVYLDIIHNTAHIYGNGINSRTFFTYGNVGFIDVRNNNFTNMAYGYAFYISTVSATIYSDRNNLYTNGTALGYYHQNIADLASWQMYSVTLDSHSVSTDPGYISSTSYQITSANLNGSALPYPGINTDIEGKPRDPSNPDIGAYEFTPAANDAGVQGFQQPAVTFTMIGQPVTIEINFRNYGTNTITSLTLGYQINNAPPVQAAWSGTLLSGASDNFTFPQQVFLPQGSNIIKAFVVLAGDQVAANDTLVLPFTSMPVANLPFADGFDASQNIWATGGSQQLWQRGIPTGTLLGSAYSAPNVWATNLAGDYTENAEEFLYSPFFNFTNVQNATLSFRHWHETADNSDGLQVQVSTSGGATWNTLGFYLDPTGTNWYNHLQSGQHYFTGISGTWNESSISLSAYNNATTPVQFRFRFFSDGAGTLEGWVIDDFRIMVTPAQTDAAMMAITAPAGATPTGSTNLVTVMVKNTGLSPIPQMQLRYSINGSLHAAETYTGVLAPDSVLNYTFTATYQAPAGHYTLCAKATAPGDLYTFNDSVCLPVYATPAPFDAGITQIVSPTDSLTDPGMTQVTVEITNFGTSVLTAMNVEYKIGINTPVVELWSGNLQPGNSALFTFATPCTPPPGGLFTFCARTILPNDGNGTNDELCQVMKSYIGTNTQYADGFSLGQNQPNPAVENTAIDISLPASGTATLEIINSKGQIVLIKTIHLTAGRHSIRIETGQLTPGIYYYSLTANGQRKSRKMVIAAS
jgi:hypothetical protein